jgi:hypothetical protein
MTLTDRINRSDRRDAALPVIAPHDPTYCDQYRPAGHACNQPHAASDPMGVRQPRWLSRLSAKDMTGMVAL